MRQDDWRQLNDMVITAATTVLTDAGVDARYRGTEAHSEAVWDQTISIIGLGGDKLRGSIVLSVPATLLASSHPTRGTSADDLADWLSELANLLLGQVKSRLVTRGVVIEMSTPITLTGTALRIHRFKGLPITHTFTAPGGEVRVMFEAVGEESAQLSQEQDESAALDGGEMMIF